MTTIVWYDVLFIIRSFCSNNSIIKSYDGEPLISTNQLFILSPTALLLYRVSKWDSTLSDSFCKNAFSGYGVKPGPTDKQSKKYSKLFVLHSRTFTTSTTPKNVHWGHKIGRSLSNVWSARYITMKFAIMILEQILHFFFKKKWQF